MTTQEVANQVIELFRQGKFEEAHDQFYSDDIVSIEAEGSPMPVAKGRAAIAEKGRKFEDSMEAIHSMITSDPLVAENFFSCTMKMNMTPKGAPGPVQMDEVCVFEVRDGKIVKEQFFYTPAPQPA